MTATSWAMRSHANVRAVGISLEICNIPDAEGFGAFEGSKVSPATGRGGHISGGVYLTTARTKKTTA